MLLSSVQKDVATRRTTAEGVVMPVHTARDVVGTAVTPDGPARKEVGLHSMRAEWRDDTVFVTNGGAVDVMLFPRPRSGGDGAPETPGVHRAAAEGGGEKRVEPYASRR